MRSQSCRAQVYNHYGWTSLEAVVVAYWVLVGLLLHPMDWLHKWFGLAKQKHAGYPCTKAMMTRSVLTMLMTYLFVAERNAAFRRCRCCSSWNEWLLLSLPAIDVSFNWFLFVVFAYFFLPSNSQKCDTFRFSVTLHDIWGSLMPNIWYWLWIIVGTSSIINSYYPSLQSALVCCD